MTLPRGTTGLTDLPATWRDKAGVFRLHASEPLARAYEACAGELEAKPLAQDREAPLTLSEAAEASGYSADHLGRMVRQGTIPNVGRHGAPRIRLGDLPRKLARSLEPSQIDATAIVQSVINEGV